MINIKNKHKLLAVLIVVPVIIALFILNSIMGDANDENLGNTQIPLTSESLKQTIPAKIDSILFSFGIKKEWIKNIDPSQPDSSKKSKSKEKPKPKYANAWLIKNVEIPRDLPLSDVNYELTNYLASLKLNTIAFEDPRSSSLSLELLNAAGDTGNVEAVINVSYNDSLSRNGSEIALILTNTEQYTPAELKTMLESPENFSIVLPIDYKYSDIQSLILESGNDYILFYSIGQEDDFSADFRENVPEKEWKSKVKFISIAFPKAAAVILNNPEQLYKYEKAIREHFLEYRPNVFRDTLYTDIRNSELPGGPVDKIYESILSNSKAGKKYQIYIAEFTPAEFDMYKQRIYELKKKGHKFVSLSKVLRNMEKTLPKDKRETDSLKVENKK
jgi:hypothetical protein